MAFSRPPLSASTARTAVLFATWYLMSGAADGVANSVVRDAGLVALPCWTTFVVSFLLGTAAETSSLFVAATSSSPHSSSPVLAAPSSPAAAALSARSLARHAKAGGSVAAGVYCLYWGMSVWGMQQTYAVKTSEPLVTTLVALLLGERVGAGQVAAIAVVCAGSACLALAQGTGPAAAAARRLLESPAPFVAVQLSNLFLAMRTVFVKRLLDGDDAASAASSASSASPPPSSQQTARVPPHPLSVFRHVSAAAAAVLTPLSVAELLWVSGDSLRSLAPSLFAGCFYFAYNCSGFVILSTVSSSTYAVGKELRCLAVYAWTALYLGQAASAMSLAGAALVVAGTVAYGAESKRWVNGTGRAAEVVEASGAPLSAKGYGADVV